MLSGSCAPNPPRRHFGACARGYGNECGRAHAHGRYPDPVRQAELLPHREGALDRCVTPLILRLRGIELDIDRPQDVRECLACGSATLSHAYLDRCNATARLPAAYIDPARPAIESN